MFSFCSPSILNVQCPWICPTQILTLQRGGPMVSSSSVNYIGLRNAFDHKFVFLTRRLLAKTTIKKRKIREGMFKR